MSPPGGPSEPSSSRGIITPDCNCDDGRVADLLVVYTDLAEQNPTYGAASIHEFIALIVGIANQACVVGLCDLELGAQSLWRVSVDSSGQEARDYSRHPSVSGDGRWVAFMSAASNLVPADTNDSIDVFLHDRQRGTTLRVSVASSGQQANSGSDYPAISADGRRCLSQLCDQSRSA